MNICFLEREQKAEGALKRLDPVHALDLGQLCLSCRVAGAQSTELRVTTYDNRIEISQ